MFGYFSGILAVSLFCTTLTPSVGWAIIGEVDQGEVRFCADMLASVFHPETGEEIVARDLCEYKDLLDQGYLPERPQMCAATFGYVRHPVSGATQTYRNSCQLEALIKAGYTLLLRNPRSN